jgi:lipopolysaccharide/colanic/teichoic acid biosynthesis glycosyltransferase
MGDNGMDQESELRRAHKIDPSGIMTLSYNRMLYYLSKRILDIFFSSIALIIISPILLIVAVLIHFDSPGPVIFTQKRVGSKRIKRGGHYYWERTEFPCHKFRTMIDKADPSIHQAFINALINHDEEKLAAIQGSDNTIKKIVNDRRCTRIGHILRSTSVDELPQFWNVFRGEMSLVGPRPAIPYEVEMYKPWYFRRFEAKPGLTGLWQITARNSCDFDSMVKLDLEYIENQSFWYDLKIVIMTPLFVLFRKGVA